MATLLTETWTGADGAVWPAGWTTRVGTATIQSNAGRIAPAADGYASGRVDNTGMASAGDTDLLVSVTGAIDSVEQSAYAFIDSDGGTVSGNWEPDNCFFAGIGYAATAASSTFYIGQSVAGVITVLATLTRTLTGTTKYNVRVQRTGTTLNARMWAASGAEPGTWDVTATVTAMSGRVGLLAANGVDTTVRLFAFDDLVVTDGVTAAALTAAPADSEGLTDSLATVNSAVRAQADTAGLTDSLGTANAAVRAAADPEGFADAVTTVKSAVRLPADPEGFTDSLAVTRAAVRALADPEGFTDSLAVANDAVRSPADALGATDALTVTRAIDRAQADSARWTDGVTAATDAARTPADLLGMADSLAVQWDRAGTVADSLGLTDTATGVAAGEGVLADPLGLADDLTTAADRIRNVADSLGFTDSVTDVSDAARSQTDPLGLADTVSEANANSRAGTDAAGLTDTLSASFELVRSPADPVGFSDSLSVIWSRSVTLGDSFGLADAATPSGSAIGLRDLTLGAYPLHDRFALESLLPRFELGHLEDRFMSVSLAGRWSVARLEGEAMRKEVLVSAGAVEYVGGTVTELTGKDISGATFMMSLGGPANPGAWVAPSVSTVGGTPASRVLKLLVNSASPKGTFYAWARVTDAPEVAPVRFPQEIIVR